MESAPTTLSCKQSNEPFPKTINYLAVPIYSLFDSLHEKIHRDNRKGCPYEIIKHKVLTVTMYYETPCKKSHKP